MQTMVPFAIVIVSILMSNLFITVIPLYQANTSDRILVFLIVGLMAYAIARFFIGIYAETI